MDLRLIIGRLMVAIGLLLIMAAMLIPDAIKNYLYGTNLNLAWGIVLVASGALFSFASCKAK